MNWVNEIVFHELDEMNDIEANVYVNLMMWAMDEVVIRAGESGARASLPDEFEFKLPNGSAARAMLIRGKDRPILGIILHIGHQGREARALGTCSHSEEKGWELTFENGGLWYRDEALLARLVAMLKEEDLFVEFGTPAARSDTDSVCRAE